MMDHPESLYSYSLKLIQDKSGIRGKQDRGFKLLKKAADVGSCNAMIHLGELLKRAGKHKSALEYIQKAHEKGRFFQLML